MGPTDTLDAGKQYSHIKKGDRDIGYQTDQLAQIKPFYNVSEKNGKKLNYG